MLSPAPEHDFHTSCAQSRQGRSGASGPGVWNGALVQARAHLFKKLALACARACFLHLMFVNAFFRGRRQLPQAGEVRRPPGPACVRRWRYRFKNTVLEEHDGTRQEEQGGWGNHSYQPPPVPGPPFAAGNSKGGWGNHSYQPPPPPGPLLRYLSSGMGRPGAGGRTCEMALWCRRGRIF